MKRMQNFNQPLRRRSWSKHSILFANFAPKFNHLILILGAVNNIFHTLRLSGSSERPAYPGFIVIKMLHDRSSESSVPSKTNTLSCSATARCIVWTCWAITDSTYDNRRIHTIQDNTIQYNRALYRLDLLGDHRQHLRQ